MSASNSAHSAASAADRCGAPSIVASYGLVAGMVLAAATGERGIGKRLAGPPTAMWWAIKVLYRVGVLFQLASVGLLLVASLRSLVGD